MDFPVGPTPVQAILQLSIAFLLFCALILLGGLLRRRTGSTAQTGSLVFMSLGVFLLVSFALALVGYEHHPWNKDINYAIGALFGVAAIVGWMWWRRVRPGSKAG